MRHIFICGCPRSGTTAAWRLLANQTSTIIGVERYGTLFFSKDFMTPQHFEKERFMKMKKNDTFYDDLVEFNNYYSKIEGRWDKAAYVGDKLPKLYLFFDNLQKNFDDVIVFFMIRNIFDVASSYQARALDPDDHTWSRDHGVERAIEDWTTSIRRFKDWHERLTIVPVCYETLFYGDGRVRCFDKLEGLDVELLDRDLRGLRKRAGVLADGRARLHPNQMKYISTRAPFAGYREVIQLAEQYA